MATGMMTSVKIPRELRERVQKYAVRDQTTQAAVISRALDLLDRQSFFEQLREDVNRRPEPAAEQREREEWLAGPVVSSAQ